jgi:hypothetical protein
MAAIKAAGLLDIVFSESTLYVLKSFRVASADFVVKKYRLYPGFKM